MPEDTPMELVDDVKARRTEPSNSTETTLRGAAHASTRRPPAPGEAPSCPFRINMPPAFERTCPGSFVLIRNTWRWAFASRPMKQALIRALSHIIRAHVN